GLRESGCPRDFGRAGRGHGKSAMDIARCIVVRTIVRSHPDSVFSTRPVGDYRAEPRGVAWRADGHHFTVEEQSAVRALGFAGDVVAGVGTGMSHLVDAAAV